MQVTQTIDYIRLIARIFDSYFIGNRILTNEILIDETEDDESLATNVESDTNKLQPGLHKWEIMFLSNQESTEEINRILSIVETAAKKTGQVIGETCKTGDVVTICTLHINNGVSKDLKSKIHKRQIENQNDTQVTDEDVTKDEPNEAVTARSDSSTQDCDPDLLVTKDDEVYCSIQASTAFSAGCPTGTGRADDGTCVPEVE